MRRVILTGTSVLLFALAASATAQSYEIVHSFTARGGEPVAGLLVLEDGTLIGASQYGGDFGKGDVFALTPNGTGGYAFSELHSFYGPDGSTPQGTLIRSASGVLYGTTSAGGEHGGGTVFSLDASGRLTVLHSFDVTEGWWPAAGLVIASDGFLYGTTSAGGNGGNGGVFRISTGGSFSTIHLFAGADGSNPKASLIEASDGALYGTTYAGGVPGWGTVFRVASGTVVKVADLVEEASPEAALTLGPNAILYGVTRASGIGIGLGTIFQVDTSTGSVTLLHLFVGTDGNGPRGALTPAPDGWFDGTTIVGGAHDAGVVYRFRPGAGEFEKIYDFDGGVGVFPEAAVSLLADGAVVSTASEQGGFGRGSVFRVDTGGAASMLHAFVLALDGAAPADPIQASDGFLYGATESGGEQGRGIIYRMDLEGGLEVLHDFVLPEGELPISRLLESSDGSFVGTTPYGGSSSAGTIFRWDPQGGFATLHEFTGDDGRFPRTGVIQIPDGDFYGTTNAGGTNDYGTVFRLDTSNLLTTLHSFANSDGSYPSAELVIGPDGNFHGTTTEGGAIGLGTVFHVDAAGTLTTDHEFDSTFGATPQAGLVVASDGNYYGTATGGGAFGFGTIYRIDSAGAFSTVHDFTGGEDTGYPQNTLLQGSDGLLYGVTALGGQANLGSLIRSDTKGTVQRLYDLDDRTGWGTFGALIEASDGNFYGGALFSGGRGAGVVFRLSLTSSPPALDAATPDSGPAAGGTVLTVSGSHLRPESTVAIGGVEARGPADVDAHEMLAISPTLSPGTIHDLVVTNPDGAIATLPLAWFADFVDVDATQLFHDSVESVARAGVSAGCGGGAYCVNDGATRAQAAVLQLKAEHGGDYVPPPCTGIFVDVPCPEGFAVDWIEQLVAEGISDGCGGGRFCPDVAVTRAQAAVLTLKTSQGAAYTPPAAVGIFADVPVGAFAADWIEDLFARGITAGCSTSPRLYCPGAAVTRGQLAALLRLAFDLP